MKRVGFLILRISETHWDTNDEFTLVEGNFIFSSAKRGHTRVVTVDAKAIKDRLGVVQINAAPSTISTIQAYAPTSAAPEEEIDEFYSVLEGILALLPRSHIKLMLEYFNAKIGKIDNNDG